MNEPVNKRAIGVGAFIIIGLLFLVAGVLTIGNLHSTFQKKMTISTLFGDVNGLQAGNNIWFSGVKIGTVKKTEFYGRSQVKVTMNINVESKQYIRKDAKVKISTDGLIGNKILVIYGGSSNVPPVEEGDTLSNELMLTMEDIMTTFQKSNLNVLSFTNNLANGNGTIGKLLKSDSLYNSINAAVSSLRIASANAQKLTSSIADFSAKLNKKGSLPNDIATDTILYNSLKASVLQLHRITDTAGIFVSNLKGASENPKSTVGVLLKDEEAAADLKATLGNLKSSTEKLDAELEALKHTFLLRRALKKEAKEDTK